MEYITKDQGSYQLHIIKTNAFKTITVKIYLKEIAKKENITKRNFLNDILSKLGTSSLNLGVDKMTFTINPNNVHYKEIRIDGHLTINDQNFKAVLPLVIS